jgi:hypothetical protein
MPTADDAAGTQTGATTDVQPVQLDPPWSFLRR